VASGDLLHLPYLVMEHIPGQSLQQWLDVQQAERTPVRVEELIRIGVATAKALQSLHAQNVCHLDLKPANLLLCPDGRVVLLDFGLSCHAHYPDLLAEELRKAVGSPTWMAPEQVVGVRGDPRSDIFALGVILYELATGELPFGDPQTQGGLRQRLWMKPAPPQQHRPDLPDWLQEVILRCLQAQAQDRYPSAAHLAFDLRHPEHVQVRGLARQGVGWWAQLRRWLWAAGQHYQPSALPAQLQIREVPIVMVAMPHEDVSEATLYSLRAAAQRSLGNRPGARLAVITVMSPNASSSTDSARSETALHRQQLAQLQRWAQPLDLSDHQASFHVLESGDVATALLRYAHGNAVDLIVMGAATHGLQLQRLIATVPIKVAMDAPMHCDAGQSRATLRVTRPRRLSRRSELALGDAHTQSFMRSVDLELAGQTTARLTVGGREVKHLVFIVAGGRNAGHIVLMHDAVTGGTHTATAAFGHQAV